MNPPTQVNAMLRSAPRQTAPLRRPATRVPTICIVDPKPDDYLDWGSLAQDSGVRLQKVGSAEEALRIARTAAVDLWVVNANLPGLSGYELTSMLKGRFSAVPVLLVVDEYSPEAEQKAWAAHPTLFLASPAAAAWLRPILSQSIEK